MYQARPVSQSNSAVDAAEAPAELAECSRKASAATTTPKTHNMTLHTHAHATSCIDAWHEVLGCSNLGGARGRRCQGRSTWYIEQRQAIKCEASHDIGVAGSSKSDKDSRA